MGRGVQDDVGFACTDDPVCRRTRRGLRAGKPPSVLLVLLVMSTLIVMLMLMLMLMPMSMLTVVEIAVTVMG